MFDGNEYSSTSMDNQGYNPDVVNKMGNTIVNRRASARNDREVELEDKNSNDDDLLIESDEQTRPRKKETKKQKCQCIMSAIMVVLIIMAIALLIPTLVYVEQVKTELITQQTLIHQLNTTISLLSNSTTPPSPLPAPY